MKMPTSRKPRVAATMPACFASSPTVGDTDDSARSFSGAGSAPALRSFASCCASAGVKEPVIWPSAPISLWMTGAETSVSSRMMASWRPRPVRFFGPPAM